MGGGNRNSQSKAERRIDRKQRREAEARQNHREKTKAREKEIKEENKDKPKKPKEWKRTDKDGSVILWNAIKISKTSRYVLAGMATIVILFAISPVFEMPDYVPPERYSFAECEAIDFEDVYCMYDFKWTREYADGGVIVEYAEFNPFVDIDVDENKYTEEQQDFLPPGTQFILPFAYGTHDYMSGYAEHDKFIFQESPQETAPVKFDEFGITFIDDKLPTTPEALTELINDIRLELDQTEAKLTDVEHDLQTWNIDEQLLDNDRFSAESAYEDAEEDLDKARTTYRHAQDMTIRNNDDRLEQDAAFLDYKIQLRHFNEAENEYFNAMLEYDTAVSEHYELENLETELNDKLDDLLIELSEARTKLNLTFREYQFINVNLSKTCQTLIKYELNTQCPTYREMVVAFDNTIPSISGEFVDVGYDLKRLPSPMDNHWKYYKQITKTRVVSVDADPELFDRGVNIIIQAKDFSLLEQTGRSDKSASYNSETLEQTTWKNMHVSDKCDEVSVGPDMKAIEDAILHVLNKCTTDLSDYKVVTQQEPTIIPKEQSAHYQYFQWLKDVIAGLRDTTVEYVTQR